VSSRLSDLRGIIIYDRDFSMRGLIVLAILIGIGLTIDAFVYDGRYRRQAWNDASYQAQMANSEVQYWIRKLGR
jgi:hypothetical protein